MNSIRERVTRLGFILPTLDAPVANYIHRSRVGNTVFVSGQICTEGGVPSPIGKLGTAMSTQIGYAAARNAGLRVIAQIAGEVADMASAVQLLRLGVFVASDDYFTAHSEVANGASDILVAVFGERGRHARTAIGVRTLPAGVPVEVDAVFAVLAHVD